MEHYFKTKVLSKNKRIMEQQAHSIKSQPFALHNQIRKELWSAKKDPSTLEECFSETSISQLPKVILIILAVLQVTTSIFFVQKICCMIG